MMLTSPTTATSHGHDILILMLVCLSYVEEAECGMSVAHVEALMPLQSITWCHTASTSLCQHTKEPE